MQRGEIPDRAAAPAVAQLAALALGRSGASEVEVVNDSELVAKQVNGVYRVKHPDMRPLHAQAMAALGAFEHWRVRSVPREQNVAADALVNEALDRAA